MNKGIPYFPLECRLNDKFALIEAEFGLTGFAVIVKLYQKIYGQQGYYCEFNDEVALLFSKELGLGGNAVSEIVSAAIKRGLFDKDIFDKYSVLTSVGIQERYFEAVERRKKIEVKKAYLLLKCAQIPKNVYILEKNAYIFEKNADIPKQRRVKESKVKESRGEERKAADKPPPTPPPNAVKHKHGEYCHVLLTDDEYNRLNADYGQKVLDDYIKRLDEYLENRKDKHYSSHNLTIRNWINKDGAVKTEINNPSFDLDAIFEHAVSHTPKL